MDNLGKGVGHVGVDGAFERFLTAAIATIITIMFSWRLLAEENENFGDIPPGAVGRTPALMYIGSRKRDEDDDKEQNTSIGISENKTVESGRPFKDQNGICHFDVDGDEKQPEGVMSGLTTNSLDGDIDEPPDYDSSWADYDPDEDMYGEFHTRRSVRDFITTENKDRKKDRYSFSDSDTEVSENIVPTSHEYLEQLYVNKEYSSITEGDVNLNEQIGDDSCDSESESESDEGEYEPPMVDSDEEPYYPSVLEPIIEEDSDDSVENDEKHEIVSKKSKRPSEPKTGSRHFGIKPDQGGNLVSKSGSGEITEADDQINHVDLFTSEQSTHLETCEYENQSELRNKPPHLDFIEIENQNIEDVEIDDSLPASPIRTSALDDKDGYFSDESCSSSSVVTVVSLPTYERRKLNENICSDSLDLSNNETSIKTDKLVDTCLPSQEHLNTGGGHVPDQIKNDIIAFIHGVPDQSTETNHDTSKLNTFLNNDSIEGDQNLDLNVTETTGTPDSVYTQNHKHGSDKTAEKLGKHVGISYNDFVTDLELNGKENFNSETNVSETDKTNDNQDSVTDQENIDVSEEEVSLESPLNTSLDNIDVPDEIYNHVDQKEGEKTDTEVSRKIQKDQDSPVVYPESDEEPREFPIDIDSDEGPREYNPDEDDFARFNSDLDSDEDSFYLLIGGNENLRKLETFTNLNVVGLSPGAYSGDEVTYFDESEKKIVFSRTEEVVTDHSVKCYVKDREASADKLAEISEVNDSGSEDKHNKSFEEEQKEILDDLELLLEIESEKEETINEVKSEEVKIDTAFDDIDQNSNVKLGEISDINSNSVDIDQLKEQVSELLNNCETVNEVETKSETSLPPRKDSDKETENLSPQQRKDSAENDKQLSPDRSYETVRKLNSENTGAETVIPGDIKLSTDDQINESVGVSNTEVGVVIDESEQQVADLIECKTNVNNKSNLIDNKTNSHEEALTFTKSLNHNSEASVCSNDFKNNVSNENQCETSNSVSNSEIKTNVKNNSHSGNNEGRLIPIAFDTLVDEKVPISVSEIKSENQKSDRVSENLIFSQNSKNNENEEDGLEKVAFENLVDEKVSKVSSSIFDFKLVNPKCNEVSENLNSNKNSKSVEDVTIGKLEESIKPCIDILSNSVQTNNNSNNKESETRKSEIPKVKNCIESLKSNSGKESNSSSGASREIKSSGYKPGASRDYNSLPNFSSRVVHTSAQRPSGYKGVKGKITKQLQYKPKQYSSVLQQPIIIETHKSVVIDTPEKSLPKSRQKILVSRKRFLSEENLSTLPKPFKDPFSQHKASFTKTAPRQRRYAKRDENSAQARRNLSFDRIDRLRDLCQSPRISEDSFEKPEIDNLHADCIFSPHKHEQIMNTTLSIDNSHAQLLRYGSVASLVETDIDSGETFETRIFPETDIDEHDFHFQVPLQRTASMSELGNRTKPRRGRFADRNVPKSKSLQTLETNIDDVFTAEGQGNLARVPSVHELRVSKSLSKLNVPDWYKKSSVSRSGSTFSLYSSRRDSTSTINSFGQPPSLTTSPCPSVTPGSNAVVIRTRVTPSSAKLVRAPLLPTTPEKSPLPPSILKLPSDKFRQKEQPKQLMPIPIVPFSKLRLMFESKSKKDKTRTKESDIKSPISPLPKSALKSPTSPEVPNISKTLSVTPSAKENSIIESEILVAQKSPTASISPSSTMTDSHQKRTIEPVKNGRILHSDTNKPQVPDKPKSLLVNTVAPQHNTEPPAPSREHNSTKHVRYSIPSQSQHPPVQKEQVSRRLAPPVAMVQPQSQSRKETTV
ncbi:hypothetical protein KUTeg_022561 [Tegillarca granosa]|uniref:Uncharacterized protein n=1 Tax=Tegillarca granosa TaxID=220873 RepID=A0ABQ9E6W3_TEGGR|nr:hypothetical protein KUTeg_022561 [Tegillarca granosa]